MHRSVIELLQQHKLYKLGEDEVHRLPVVALRAIDFGHQKRLESLNFWNF